jgi:hypothetical protein
MRLIRSVVVAALAVGGLAAMPLATASTTSDYQLGLSLGHEAYEYGIPLMDTERTFQTETSVSAPDGSGDGPVNQFNSIPRLVVPTASQRTVVAPNADTLYSLAWLDLSDQPQVVHVPAISGRFYTLELLSPWTENFYNIASVSGPASTGTYNLTTGGDFVVVPPGYQGTIPAGLRVVHSPYSRVWIIGRTYVRGAADTPAVNAIQQQFTISPLSEWGTSTPVTPEPGTGTPTYATVPGAQPGEDPLDFYVALNRELQKFAPMAGDGPLLTKLRQIDVGPGLNPATDSHLSADVLRGMRDAVTQGPAKVKAELKQMYVTNSLQHNGYLVVGTGSYGTDYRLRAIVDQIGLGANLPNVAVYPIAQTDRLLQTLTGANKYVLHIPAKQLPPVQGYWSLTMYDMGGFFVQNALGRYNLNQASNFHRNADGSIDLYVQRTAPTSAAQRQNWLPAPAGAFRLMWRLYGLGSALSGVLSGTGWKPPAIQRCAGGVGLPNLTRCAT